MRDCCEHGNEFSGSVKEAECLNLLGECKILKDSTPWSQVKMALKNISIMSEQTCAAVV